MVEKRINNTDPVVQVRLCVMVGNFHGARKKVRLAAGFVYPKLGIFVSLGGIKMQNPSTHKRIFGIESDSRKESVVIIATMILFAIAAVVATIALDVGVRP